MIPSPLVALKRCIAGVSSISSANASSFSTILIRDLVPSSAGGVSYVRPMISSGSMTAIGLSFLVALFAFESCVNDKGISFSG